MLSRPQSTAQDPERPLPTAKLVAAISGAKPAASLSAGQVLEVQAALLSRDGFEEAAVTFATEIASTLNFDRAVVGFLSNGRSKIIATSNTADFEPNLSLFNAFSAAMDEALDQASTIVFPAADHARPLIMLAHAEIARLYGGVVCTVPLVSRGNAFGAVTLVRTGSTIPNDDEIAQYEDLACLAGPILQLKYEAERPFHQRMLRSLRAGSRLIAEPGNTKLKIGTVAGLAGLLAILFLPVQYRVGSPARLEGSIQHALVAPVDGFLHRVNARPGDRVKRDQVLAELAVDDLRLEQRKWQSEQTQHENAASAALSRADRTQFVISQAMADAAHAQLELVDGQLSRANIAAPFDGLVIAGDLSQSLGAPVQRGEVLLTVAPVDEFRLTIEVDEREIDAISRGQTGRLALAALSSGTLGFRVERLTPVAVARDGRNFFEVEGRLDETPAMLRPGLLGVAKIHVGERSLMWIWTHRLADWMRLTVWSWGF